MKKIKIRKVIGRNILILKLYSFNRSIQVRYKIGVDITVLHSCMSDQKFKSNQLEIIEDYSEYDIELFKQILLKEIELINNTKYKINRYSFKKFIDRDVLNSLYYIVKDKNSFKEI